MLSDIFCSHKLVYYKILNIKLCTSNSSNVIFICLCHISRMTQIVSTDVSMIINGISKYIFTAHKTLTFFLSMSAIYIVMIRLCRALTLYLFSSTISLPFCLTIYNRHSIKNFWAGNQSYDLFSWHFFSSDIFLVTRKSRVKKNHKNVKMSCCI